MQWLRVGCLLCHALPVLSTPAYFASVANQALRLKGGASFGGDMSVRAALELEQQVKRVMGANPAQDLNVSSLRDSPDTELLRILFLAVLGNFTSAASAEWHQPCSLVVSPETGLVTLHDPPPLASLAQKAVVILLIAVQIRQWVLETRAATDDQKGKDK